MHSLPKPPPLCNYNAKKKKKASASWHIPIPAIYVLPPHLHFPPFNAFLLVVKMVTIVVRATYTEQNALESFFTDIFGWGTVTVLVRLQ